jgi:hypothetical protein
VQTHQQTHTYLIELKQILFVFWVQEFECFWWYSTGMPDLGVLGMMRMRSSNGGAWGHMPKTKLTTLSSNWHSSRVSRWR